jgi:catechol 2,3-dioxygenase-like lactoylglutathione lyase family enzyme
MARGQVHHLDLTVCDLERSRDFCQTVLGFMGYRLAKQDVRGFDFDREPADGCFASIAIVRAEGAGRERAHCRYAPGLHHIALHAASRADVNALHAVLVRR